MSFYKNYTECCFRSNLCNALWRFIPQIYNSVHMCDPKKNAWKGYFFHMKARNARDALRVSKTVYFGRKGYLNFGTISNLFFLIYMWVLTMHNLSRKCKLLTKTCKGYTFLTKTWLGSLFPLCTCLGDDFHQGVKTCGGGGVGGILVTHVYTVIFEWYRGLFHVNSSWILNMLRVYEYKLCTTELKYTLLNWWAVSIKRIPGHSGPLKMVYN